MPIFSRVQWTSLLRLSVNYGLKGFIRLVPDCSGLEPRVVRGQQDLVGGLEHALGLPCVNVIKLFTYEINEFSQ